MAKAEIVMSEISVIGMGFVGIPLSVAFDDAGHDVVGYDIDPDRILSLRQSQDPTDEVCEQTLWEGDVEFTSDPAAIGGSEYAIIAVPTPIDDWKRPELSAVTSAGKTVGEHLSRGMTVVLESTVYPGATKEVLVPALEASSGLESGQDFTVGYSPERIAPGSSDQDHLQRTSKIVSGQDDETLADLVTLYESIIEETVHPAPTIETAEASKCLENVQRDVNIGLINEFVMGCQRLDVELDPRDVLEAARTKSAFHDYRPGLVGGHCIPVDPHFLVSRFQRNGFDPTIMEGARRTNESFSKFLAESMVKQMAKLRAQTRDGVRRDNGRRNPVRNNADSWNSRALILGFSYKPNVNDIRNDVLHSLIRELESYEITACGHDPLVPDEELEAEFDIETVADPDLSSYDAILVTALHDEFRDYGLEEHLSEHDRPYVLDLTGHFRKPSAAVLPRKNVS